MTSEQGQILRTSHADVTGLVRWLPGLHMLRRYEPAWLRHDILAGLVLTAMLVPVGIAYAVASGVPGIYGLYATIVPLLAYALFGPSRILVLGPDSALAAVILAVVLPLSGGDPQRAVALAGVMAHGLRRRLRRGRPRAARLRHRAAVEADPLRLHERHRADGAAEPASQAVRLLDRARRTAAADRGRSARQVARRRDATSRRSRSARARWR